MNPHVFRDFDIRGVAERDLGEPFVLDLGRATGTHLLRHGGRRIALGRDARLSSPRIHAALLRGVVSTGLSVVDLGVVPTPMLYFAVHRLELDGGVMITGSHNAAGENGFKILRARSAIHGGEIQQLRRLIEARDFERGSPPGTITYVDLEQGYLTDARENLRPLPRPLHVVIDGGNGVGGSACVSLLRSLGVEVTALHCEPDGTFPGHPPDPTIAEHLSDLRREVLRSGAEAGLALDGDGDRLVVVDGAGRILEGDQLVMLFARAVLSEHPGATIIADVKCSQVLFDEIARRGGRPVMWKVGHSFIKEKMREEGAIFAGEFSGHLFFADRHPGYDDGIYAAARLAELLARSTHPLEVQVDSLPRKSSSPEVRFPFPDERKAELVRRVADAFRGSHGIVEVDGARITFEGGWALVRASQTAPVVALRFEASSPERLAQIRREIELEVERAAEACGPVR